MPAALDVPALLGIPGRGASLVALVFTATVVTLALTAGGDPMRTWTGWAALAVTVAATAAVVSPGRYPLGRVPSTLIAASAPLAAVLIVIRLDPPSAPGYSAWYVLSGTLVLLALAVRGRILLAWAAFAALVAVNVAWSTLTGRGPLLGVTMVQAMVAVLLFGSLFAVGLRRLLRRLERVREAEVRLAAETATARTVERERLERLQAVERLVREPLALLAGRGEIDGPLRARLVAVEGRIRDSIRAPSFGVEPALGAAGRARARGVDVLLLQDDAGPAEPCSGARPDAQHAAMATAVAEALDALPAGSATFRLTAGDAGAMVLRSTTQAPGAAAVHRERRFTRPEMKEARRSEDRRAGGAPPRT